MSNIILIETWLAFVFASAVILVIPGPTILTVVSYSLAHGKAVRWPLVTAVALGDATALSLSLFGLGALLANSAFWFTLIRTAGGLYLLWLGLRMLQAGAVGSEWKTRPASSSPGKLFANTWLVTALNPKGIVFFIAFLPQFVRPGAAVAPQLWLLATTFVVLASINAACYAIFAGSARHLLTSPRAQRCLHLSGGLLLSAAGAWALFSGYT